MNEVGTNPQQRTGLAQRQIEEILMTSPAGRDPDWTSANWGSLLHRLGLAPGAVRALMRQAEANRTDFRAELLVSGLVTEEALYSTAADELGLPYSTSFGPSDLVVSDDAALAFLRRHEGLGLAHARTDELHTAVLAAPANLAVEKFRGNLQRFPGAFSRICLTTPKALRKALLDRAAPNLLRTASMGLAEKYPELSAYVVANAWQGAAIGALSVLVPFSLAFFPAQLLFALVLVSAIFFFACAGLRLLAATSAEPPQIRPVAPFDAAEMPVYTVLVALYREPAMIGELLISLGRLVWPRAKLEIKLVCEADDKETLAAIAAHDLRHWVEVIEVPPGLPRTKPKALNFALQASSGDFVVLYDAEDRPEPLQLIEAWQSFKEAPLKLACLQAPLSITNGASGQIAAMFAFEYNVLFRGLLPWLAKHKLILPLGGTSNHFRRTALEDAGAWDPSNVTEDADLGARLCRFGYHSEVISRPTLEEAPENFGVWLRQRTRWMKGFALTWLVHMRSPRRLWRELGPASFLVFQILFAGIFASALIHPIFLAITAAAALNAGFDKGMNESAALLVFDLLNLAFAYGAFLGVGWAVLGKAERSKFWRKVLLTPFYWTMISLAAWRAVFQLFHNPHLWEKTPHNPPPRARNQFDETNGP